MINFEEYGKHKSELTGNWVHSYDDLMTNGKILGHDWKYTEYRTPSGTIQWVCEDCCCADCDPKREICKCED